MVLPYGLDEVAREEDRRHVAKWVGEQIEQYEGNDFVLTSRPHGYASAPVNRAGVLQVVPAPADDGRDGRAQRDNRAGPRVTCRPGPADRHRRRAARRPRRPPVGAFAQPRGRGHSCSAAQAAKEVQATPGKSARSRGRSTS